MSKVVDAKPFPAADGAEQGLSSQERNGRLALVGDEPRLSLDVLRLASVTSLSSEMSRQFGNLTLLNGFAEKSETTSRKDVPSRSDTPLQQTLIKPTGTGKTSSVSIGLDKNGKPATLADHLGNWTSEDGGSTWKTDGPAYRVRRGAVSIDERGTYSFDNSDYGVKTSFATDGKSAREIATSSGQRYSVEKNAQGVPISFQDESGQWRGDGKTWTNTATGESRTGTVSLSDYGEFRFKSNGLETIARSPQLDSALQRKERIEKAYGVKIAAPGEKGRDSDGGSHIGGMPTDRELKTLEDVLANTSHENYTGMKIWFVRPDENKENDGYGHYENFDESKTKTHSCSSGCSHSRGLVARSGSDMVIFPKARQTVDGMDGLQGTLLHELAHHEQGQRFGHETDWSGKKARSSELADVTDKLGWVYSPRHKEALLKDKEGGLWRYNESGDNWRWSGGERPSDGKRRLDNEGMQERALVRPASDYFPYSYEHQAEGLAMFRIGASENSAGKKSDGKDRRGLFSSSPDLYKVISEFDQSSIDRKFGRTQSGESKMIRDTDGKLVENTVENRRRVIAVEKSWAAK